MDVDKINTYMKMAHEIKKSSPDTETKVGAVLISKNGRIIASSYNGFLRGAIDSELPNTRPDKYVYIQHAERNMLYNCCAEGIRTMDATIVCTLSPCEECTRAAYQSGIKTIIFDKLYSKFPDTDFYTKLKDVHISIEKKGKYTILNMISRKQQERLIEEYGT